MNNIEFREHELSGARLTVPFTILGNLGPMHHAMIVGINSEDQQIWVAELSRKYGQRLVSLEQWVADNAKYISQLTVSRGKSDCEGADVARSAVAEVLSKSQSKYNLVFNNCENFVDRHSKQESAPIKLSPQVVKAFKTAGIVIAAGAIVLNRASKRSG